MSSLRITRERTAGSVMFVMTAASLLLVLVMGGGLYLKAAPILDEYSLLELLSSSEWRHFINSFGFLPFIMGTVWVTGIALALSLLLSLLTAVFLTEYAHAWVKRRVYPALDILAALPSVIYGVCGTAAHRAVDFDMAGTSFRRVFVGLHGAGGRHSAERHNVAAV